MANNFPVKDATGTSQTLKTTDTAGVHTTHHNIDTLPGSLTGKAEDAAAASADVGLPILAVRNDAAASKTSTDGDYSMLATDAAGRVGIADLGGSLTVDNAGTFATQVDGAALAALQLIDDPVVADDAAFTPGTTKVMVAGYQADETATDSVDEGDAGAARMTLDRKQITVVQPHTAGGLSIYRDLAADESGDVIKASAGQVYGWHMTYIGTEPVWVKLYNKATTPSNGDTPVMTIGVPGGISTEAGIAVFNSDIGIPFGTGIGIRVTAVIADNDATAPNQTLVVNIFYK